VSAGRKRGCAAPPGGEANTGFFGRPGRERASMPSFEGNKIIASVLPAMIVAMVSGILAGQLVRPKELAKPVFIVQGAEQTAAAPAEQIAAAGPEQIQPLLAKADPKKGEQIAKVCA